MAYLGGLTRVCDQVRSRACFPWGAADAESD